MSSDLSPIATVDAFLDGLLRHAIEAPSLDRLRRTAERELDAVLAFLLIGSRKLEAALIEADPIADSIEALVDSFAEDRVKAEARVEELDARIVEMKVLAARLGAARRRLRMEPVP